MKRLLPILAVLIVACSSGDPGRDTAIDPATGIIYPRGFTVAQTLQCDHNDLSAQFDVNVDFVRLTDSIEQRDSSIVKLLLTDKTSHAPLDSLTVTSLFYYGDIFSHCDNTRSYTTHYNTGREVVDNYYGDIIVADLNFDQLDDIAVINDAGLTSGSLYTYFLQTPDKKFVCDRYLTDSIAYFPDVIDPVQRQLVTRTPAGVCCLDVHTYRLAPAGRQWTQVSQETLGR